MHNSAQNGIIYRMKAYISELVAQSIHNLSSLEANDVLASSVFDISFPKPEFGDYATNAAMVLFKKFNEAPAANPNEFAEVLVKQIIALDKNNSFEKVESVGGFINFTLSQKALMMNLQIVLEKGDDYGRYDIGGKRAVIVEYFQNNIAKPPHVGHLRSAVIGDSLRRILSFLNYKVITDTHIGDWGVQFGILLYAYKQYIKKGLRKELIEANPVVELNNLYVDMSAQIETQPELRDLGKAEFHKLEKGDKVNRELWEWFVKASLEDFERFRELLGLLEFDHNLGESFYEDKMDSVLNEFESKGLIKTGETGEKYVDLEAFGLGRCILMKSDGATTYHLRDFATYMYRRENFDFYRNLYIVDVRQSHHFRQLFKVLELAGYPAETDSRHLEFGFMSLPEGAISTRQGNVISLENLYNEAEKRAWAIISEKNPELENKEQVSRQVALAAIKYFDLSHNRSTEIVFTWDKALTFEGNTGPYLQYTHARIYGIWRKGGIETPNLDVEVAGNLSLSPEGKAVLRKLQQFPEVLVQVANDYLPNLLAAYLFELAHLFNAFYQNIPILKEENQELKTFRLNLIKATAQVMKNGLYLLGIDAPEEM